MAQRKNFFTLRQFGKDYLGTRESPLLICPYLRCIKKESPVARKRNKAFREMGRDVRAGWLVRINGLGGHSIALRQICRSRRRPAKSLHSQAGQERLDLPPRATMSSLWHIGRSHSDPVGLGNSAAKRLAVGLAELTTGSQRAAIHRAHRR